VEGVERGSQGSSLALFSPQPEFLKQDPWAEDFIKSIQSLRRIIENQNIIRGGRYAQGQWQQAWGDYE